MNEWIDRGMDGYSYLNASLSHLIFILFYFIFHSPPLVFVYVRFDFGLYDEYNSYYSY
jgi:hypothetical protein